MPQMSPLMWSNLFVLFSLLLLISYIKIYFSNSSNLELEKNKIEKNNFNNFTWMW